jgi:hypothetical protein
VFLQVNRRVNSIVCEGSWGILERGIDIDSPNHERRMFSVCSLNEDT